MPQLHKHFNVVRNTAHDNFSKYSNLILTFILIVFLSCNSRKRSRTCYCCKLAFRTIESALECTSKYANTSDSASLLLFAVVDKALVRHRDTGWSILGHSDVIRVAQKIMF